MCHDTFVCVPRLINMCVTSKSTRLINMCVPSKARDMSCWSTIFTPNTLICMSHYSRVCAPHTHLFHMCVTSLICMFHMCVTHMCVIQIRVTHVSLICVPLIPPNNGVVALWPNTRVVKCKYYVSQKQNGFNNKIHWYSILLTFVFEFTAKL